MNNKIDWVNNIITAIISILVTVAAGAILYYWQSEKVELSYKFERIEPFDNQTEKLTIYHIEIENSGTTIIDDISGNISIENAEVTKYRTTSLTPIQIKDSLSNKKIDITIKSLNKGESCKISILAKSTTDLPIEPIVKLRAKGISTVKLNTDKESKGWLDLPFMLIAVASLLPSLISIISKKYLAKSKIGQDTDTDSGDQHHIFAYLCGVNNLTEEADRFMKLKRTAFWAETDRFGFLASASTNIDYQNKVINILTGIIEYSSDMAVKSKAICHFNIAKIYKTQNNLIKSEEHLNLAKELSKNTIEKRLKLDNIIN